MSQVLQFKFKSDIEPKLREHLITTCTNSGATVRPLFPDEEDPELSLMFTLEVADEKTGTSLLKALNSSNLIDYAEPQAKRRLIR